MCVSIGVLEELEEEEELEELEEELEKELEEEDRVACPVLFHLFQFML